MGITGLWVTMIAGLVNVPSFPTRRLGMSLTSTRFEKSIGGVIGKFGDLGLFWSMMSLSYWYVLKMIKEGYIHFIGSDCHNLDSRPPRMKACVDKLYKKISKPMVEDLLFENQSKFLKNEYL